MSYQEGGVTTNCDDHSFSWIGNIGVGPGGYGGVGNTPYES